jgi:hypothetical protein
MEVISVATYMRPTIDDEDALVGTARESFSQDTTSKTSSNYQVIVQVISP